MDTFPFLMAGLVAVGFPIAIVLGIRIPLVVALQIVIGINALIWFYLGGPAASVVVESKNLIINNACVRYVIPRGSVKAYEIFDLDGVRLSLADGSYVWVSAVVPGLVRSSSQSPRRLRRKADQILDFLDQVPAEDGEGPMKKRIQWVNMGMFSCATALFLVLTVVSFILY